MNTNELIGAALDWAVAKCEGLCEGDFAWYYDRRDTFKYSTDWAQGGPIIEREMIKVWPYDCLPNWMADISYNGKTFEGSGPTPLIAVMRCFVASRLGDEVDVPEELKP